MGASSTDQHIGLDIGTSGVRAVELSRDRKSGSYVLSRVASADLPAGAVSMGSVRDPDALRSALRTVWKQGRFRTRKVVVGLPNAVVMTRQIDLPWMPADDFRKALRYQVGDALPVDLATVQLDYHPLSEFQLVDERGMASDVNRILIVAADTGLMSDLARVVESANLEPVGMDSDAFALIRAVNRGQLPTSQTTEALVELGTEHLTVIVHSGGQPRFVRTVGSLGGDSATQAVAKALQFTHDEAEALKRETGLNGPAPVHAPISESTVFGGITSSASPLINPRVAIALEALNSWTSTVLGEIRNSLEYFRASDPSVSVGGLVLTGGAFLLDGLADRVSTELRAPSRLLSPALGLELGKRVAPSPPADTRYAVAAGLAMETRA